MEYVAGGARSESLVMRSRSGTIRRITTEHHWRKLQRITGNRYTDGDATRKWRAGAAA